ncbi:MAG: lipopolysaccharide-modifying protein [Devosia sp.]|nr:lipopolysaccharide-modifying protein [Devosia sp.]
MVFSPFHSAGKAAIGAFIGFRIRRSVRNAAGNRPLVLVDFTTDTPPFDVAIRRDGQAFRVSYSHDADRQHAVSFNPYVRAALYWFSLAGPEVERLTVNGSDGHAFSAARFAPSADPARHVLIPDPHFFSGRGYRHDRQLSETSPAWNTRSDEIVWRGAGNGDGRVSFDPRDIADPTVVQRLRLVMTLRNVPGTDVKLSGLASDRAIWTPTARRLGFVGDRCAPTSWLSRKFAIDIDGFTNAWSNFLVRMLYGCCVFKVASQFGYQQWYYDRLRPFEHYIPVSSDMSDFAERIDWARSHPAEAEAIAAAGQRFARALDFEAGTRDAVDIITAHWNDP